VQACDDHDVVRVQAIENRVRKPPEPNPTSVPIEDGVCRWVLKEPSAGFSHRIKEFGFQSPALVPIPSMSGFDIRSGSGPNDDLHDDVASRRSKTSSHGIPRGPSRSRSSSLRSNSSRCAGVRGTSSSERLSQSCSRSRSRCSGLSRPISIAGSLMLPFYSRTLSNGVPVKKSAFLNRSRVFLNRSVWSLPLRALFCMANVDFSYGPGWRGPGPPRIPRCWPKPKLPVERMRLNCGQPGP